MNINQLKSDIEFIENLGKEIGIPANNICVIKSPSTYYSKYNISINYNSIFFSLILEGSPTGCGVIILSKITEGLANVERAEYLNKVLDYMFKFHLKSAGLVMCTLGSSYYRKNGESNLISILDFEEIVEYSNPNMSNKGQKVFIKKFNQPIDTKITKKREAVGILSNEIIDNLPF